MGPKMRIASRVPLPVACAAVVLTLAACDRLGGDSETTPSGPSGPPTAGSVVSYTALGASDVIGFGSSKPCVPFSDCNGNGYVWVAARQLRSQGITVEINQLGLPAGVISRTFHDLAIQYGRNDVVWNFIQQGLPFVKREATLVTVFAGANDMNVVRDAIGRGAGGSNPTAFVDQMVSQFGADFGTLITGIRDRAQSAKIVVLNLPNLAGLPYMGGATLAQKQLAQRAAVRITTTIINTYPGITVIDLMCEPRLYQQANVASDGFHPNDGGYAILGLEVANATTGGSYPAPRSSCAQMTLF